ncbi:MAG: FAD-binding protein, partial [Halanaerobiales bacterium]
MEREEIKIEGHMIDIYSFNTVIAGSGAAGLNAAQRLYSLGQEDVAIVTEGMECGTSRNTGSDKQTYYKITAAGNEVDSVGEMAETYFKGGAMDGDLALVEAALSGRCFYNLVELGVPFPHNRFGEYVGYKTDHDDARRATSAGPYTSHYMTEKLEERVRGQGIKIFDGFQIIGILTNEEHKKAAGLLTLDLNQLKQGNIRYRVFNCTNVIYATGGPAGIYRDSVYPPSQTGATGVALEAGVKGKNLTESQFGIASVSFRWNLSGTYQQVLPRYISTDQKGGDAREFLIDYFPGPGRMLDAIFLKGYQWPFTPDRIADYGSSLIDLLVYQEKIIKGRRVWLDFTSNPVVASENDKLNFDLLGEEAYEYLNRSDALFGTPLERLQHMNYPAYELYREHGIDLSRDLLEISVCAQHNNGGLGADLWWESDLKHFFPVGEVNGSHGVYRPGGSALNAGQVGSTRATMYIAEHYVQSPPDTDYFLKSCHDQIAKKIRMGKDFLQLKGEENVEQIKKNIRDRMSRTGGILRSRGELDRAIKETRRYLENITEISRISRPQELKTAFENYDHLVTQYVYLGAIKNYIEEGGKSRGSYLVTDKEGQKPISSLSDQFRYKISQREMADKIQLVNYISRKNKLIFNWR